ncbi:MAG: Ppx/GppA phosphatase family protein [Thermohalobaculum sp.]|nr:Ppx/GppA phosphatase family protein [Thermohalobaculum sp.]
MDRGESGAERGSGPGDTRDEATPLARPRTTQPIAALDLGTNNCRLLIASPREDGFEVIDAFSRPVRLGEGVEHSNALSPEAQERAIKALRICAAKIRHHRVADARIVATEACRRATNGRAFVRRVVRETGLQMCIISAEDEARLAVAGCSPLIDPEAEQLLVFDIGGGSTELIWVDMSHTPPSRRQALIRALAPLRQGANCDTARAAAAHVSDWISVPMGVSTLHDRFRCIAEDAARFAAMAAHFRERLAPFRPLAAPPGGDAPGRLQIIGVSGTATTYGALHLGLRSYDRARVDGLWLDAACATALTERLIALGPQGRARHPGIGISRAELVISGAAILMTVLGLWPGARLRVADRGLREGMLYGILRQRRLEAAE